MAFGQGILRLTPDAFWGMTLRELSAVVRTLHPPLETLERERLHELMREFPDV
jgi:uncharacterized phage protein (TIGR02216 family)